MSEQINIGILGTAGIAKRYILPALSELRREFNIIGIASRSIDKARIFAEQYNTKAFGSYSELVDSKKIQAVYIPLPNSLHYKWIKQSLLSGIHVLVEKSLASHPEEVTELNNIAKESGFVLLENFQFRFHSQIREIKRMLEGGAIGNMRLMRSSFGFPPFPDVDNIRYQKDLGGGALLDAGAYPLKITQHFLGQDIDVDSARLEYDIEKNIDIWGSAQITSRHTSVVSQISFGFDNHYQCSVEFWGSKGRLLTNRIFTAPPGYSPTINLETRDKSMVIDLSEDNHFRNILQYFYSLIYDTKSKELEYQMNVNQSRLLSQLREVANG